MPHTLDWQWANSLIENRVYSSAWLSVEPRVNRRVPSNTTRWPNAVTTLVHCLRRWPNVVPTMGQRLVFAGVPDNAQQRFSFSEVLAQSSKRSPNSYCGPCLSFFVEMRFHTNVKLNITKSLSVQRWRSCYVYKYTHTPGNTIHRTNGGWMLVYRLRRWPSIYHVYATSSKRLVFVGMANTVRWSDFQWGGGGGIEMYLSIRKLQI